MRDRHWINLGVAFNAFAMGFNVAVFAVSGRWMNGVWVAVNAAMALMVATLPVVESRRRDP